MMMSDDDAKPHELFNISQATWIWHRKICLTAAICNNETHHIFNLTIIIPIPIIITQPFFFVVAKPPPSQSSDIEFLLLCVAWHPEGQTIGYKVGPYTNQNKWSDTFPDFKWPKIIIKWVFLGYKSIILYKWRDMDPYYGKTGMVERLTLQPQKCRRYVSTFWFFAPVVFGKKSTGFGGENRPVSFWRSSCDREVLQQSI